MPYEISLFDGAKDNAPKAARVEWIELLKELSTHEVRDTKDGAAWSPARFEGGRSAGNAREVSLAVFDLDDCSDATLARLGERLARFTYALHSTYTEGCYRLILPLDKPVPAAEWRATWDQITAAFEIPADSACRDASRLYYFPTTPPGLNGQIYSNAGKSLQPRELPAIAPIHVPRELISPLDLTAENFGESAEPVDLFEIRRQLKNIRKHESAKLIRLVLEGLSLQDEHGGRDDRMNRVASILATGVSPPMLWPVALQLLMPSLRATPQERVGHLDHWVREMRDMYDRAIDRRQRSDAKDLEFKNALLKTLGRGSLQQGEVAGEDSLKTAWRSTLLTTKGPDGEPCGIKQVGANASIIFRNDPRWAGKVRFNEVTKEIDIDAPEIKLTGKGSVDVEVSNWLSCSEFNLHLPSHIVAEQLLAAARHASYNPLQDWLKKLIWDGKFRAENFLVKYFGAEGDQRYLANVSKYWLTGAVARALQPGCKMDNVLVLRGLMGKGKSTALKVLGAPYFSDTRLEIGNKDSRLAMSRFWIIEMAELAGLKKADEETVRGFYSASSDELRVPYGKVLETFKRMCILVGTTNADEYANTVDRRYWPVTITQADIEALKEDRDQLWAEAVVMFYRGDRWWMEGEEIERAREEQTVITRSSPYVEPILQWWWKLQRKPDMVTSFEVATDALGFLKAQFTGGIQQEVGQALRALGFLKSKKRIDGRPTNCYLTPESMKDATGRGPAQIIHMK